MVERDLVAARDQHASGFFSETQQLSFTQRLSTRTLDCNSPPSCQIIICTAVPGTSLRRRAERFVVQ